MNRQEIVHAIAQNPDIDVLIIGAGINGIGTFRDLALNGINVLLVDRADFCSGASAASSHMAHGGIRYLENGEFRLVREAVEERNRLILNAPHYVEPLPTTIPIFRYLSGLLNAPLKFVGLMTKPAERGAAVIKAGLVMYDAYTGSERTVPRHQFFGRNDSLARHPQLNDDVRFTAVYYDGLIHSPERLAVELVTDALHGAATGATGAALSLTYASVESAAGDTVRIKDEESGESIDVRPKLVVNAAGPWIDFANEQMGQQTNFIGGTKGSHAVLNHPELRAAIGDSEFFFENHDGRIVLLCPLKERVLVGTSDLRIDDPDDAVCTDEEIDYFFEMVDRVFPKIDVNRSHIVYTFSGVRPLPTSDAGSTGQISRDHSVRIQEPAESALDFPIYNLIGGKWTTFRAFSEQVTDKVLERLGRRRTVSTAELPIGGGNAYPQEKEARAAWVAAQSKASGLSEKRVAILFERYGTNAQPIIESLSGGGAEDAPLATNATYSSGEIAYVVQHEQALHLVDFIMRRSSLAMLGQLTTPMLEEIAAVMGEALGWSAEERADELAHAHERLAQKHRVRLTDDGPVLV